MSIARLKLSQYSLLDEQGKADMLAEFSRSRQQPPNGQVKYLDEQISEYETTYEMSSETMLENLKSRKIKETSDICSWMMLINARKELTR